MMQTESLRKIIHDVYFFKLLFTHKKVLIKVFLEFVFESIPGDSDSVFTVTVLQPRRNRTLLSCKRRRNWKKA